MQIYYIYFMYANKNNKYFNQISNLIPPYYIYTSHYWEPVSIPITIE